MPGAPTTASALVRRAHGRWRLQRGCEAALLALSAGLVTLAAAVVSGASLLSASSCAAALVSALACAAAYWHERRLGERELALRLDHAGTAGLVLTAWESEQRGTPPGPFAELLGARLRVFLTRERAMDILRRAAPSPTPAVVLLPLFALALCAWTLEIAPRDRVSLAPLSDALAEGVAALAREPGRDPAAVDRAVAVARRVADAESAPESQLDERLRAIESELQELLAGLPEGSANDLDPARAALERARELATALADPNRRSPTSAGTGSAAAGAGALAPGPSERTMSRSLATPDAEGEPAAALFAEGRAAEAGTAAGRWWPEQYDAVVGGWLERRRAAREDQGTGIGREQR